MSSLPLPEELRVLANLRGLGAGVDSTALLFADDTVSAIPLEGPGRLLLSGAKPLCVLGRDNFKDYVAGGVPPRPRVVINCASHQVQYEIPGGVYATDFDGNPIPGDTVNPDLILVHHLPLEDTEAQELPDLRQICDWMNRLLRSGESGETVWVHCMEGKSRSVSIIVAYLILHRGMTYDGAIRHIANARPLPPPQPNPGFERQLRALEASVRASGAGPASEEAPASEASERCWMCGGESAEARRDNDTLVWVCDSPDCNGYYNLPNWNDVVKCSMCGDVDAVGEALVQGTTGRKTKDFCGSCGALVDGFSLYGTPASEAPPPASEAPPPASEAPPPAMCRFGCGRPVVAWCQGQGSSGTSATVGVCAECAQFL